MNEIESAIRSARQAQVDRIYKSFANAEQVAQDEDGITKARVPGETTEIAEENPFDAMYKSEEAEIEKARSGVYKDTAENRKKGRVGQQYGQKKADDSQSNGKAVKAVASLCDGVMAYYDEEDDAPSEGSLKKQFKLAAEKLGARGLAEQMFNYWTKNNPASPAQSGFSDDEVKEAIESAFDEFGVKIDKETKKFLTLDEEDEDEAEKAETGDLEKSDIMNAFGYGSDVKVTKTGKEIAEQVDTVILPALNAKLIEKKSDADDLLAECGNAPTKEVPVWWTGDVKIPVEYKMYDWDETCVPSNEGCGIAGSLSASDAEEKKAKYNRPENADQANARRQYNDCIRCVCEILVDIKACEILKSLKPGKEYELSTRQVVALQF